MVTKAVKVLMRSGAVYWIAASAVVWGAYQVVRPTRPGLSAAQTALAGDLERKAAVWASELEGPRASAVLATFSRDRFGVVSDRVRTALWRSDKLDLKDYGVGEKFLKAIEWTRRPADLLAEAVEQARRREAALAVWGRVEEFSSLGDQARLAAEIVVADAATGQVLAGESFDLRSRAGGFAAMGRGASGNGARMSFVTRLFVWTAASLLLPLAAYPLAKRVLASESNASTFFLLLAHALARASRRKALAMGRGGKRIWPISMDSRSGPKVLFLPRKESAARFRPRRSACLRTVGATSSWRSRAPATGPAPRKTWRGWGSKSAAKNDSEDYLAELNLAEVAVPPLAPLVEWLGALEGATVLADGDRPMEPPQPLRRDPGAALAPRQAMLRAMMGGGEMPEGWERAVRSADPVVVAVLDTGVDAEHPALAPALVAQKDFTVGQLGPVSSTGHGTHVAGIVAGRPFNANAGFSGVAPRSLVADVQVLEDFTATLSPYLYGLGYAIRQKADVLKASRRGPPTEGPGSGFPARGAGELGNQRLDAGTGDAGHERTGCARGHRGQRGPPD